MGDFLCRQTAEQTKGEGNARFGRQNGMAGSEYEAQKVIADIIVNHRVKIMNSQLLLNFDFTAEFLVLARKPRSPAQQVNAPMLRGGHQPSAWIIGDSSFRPALERGEERILCQFFGKPDVSHKARKAGDEFRGLDPPDCIDRAMCIGSRHGEPFCQPKCFARAWIIGLCPLIIFLRADSKSNH